MPAGASCALRVGFAPSERGPLEATLTSISGGAAGVSTTLLGKGIVAGALAASTATVDFAGVIPGQSAQRSVTIDNGGDQPLTLAGVAIQAADTSPFSVASSTCGANVVLSAGASCELQLEFRPLVADAPSTAELVVTSGDGQSQSIALTGVGLKAGNLVLAAATAGEEGFGDVLLGESRAHVFQVQSPGAQPSGARRRKPTAAAACASPGMIPSRVARRHRVARGRRRDAPTRAAASSHQHGLRGM